ncbi:hypothetical protein VKT23_009385 [Stygiomarasmius scandens]|uniref:Uncharacterized protein n=1 Tax=Marasmiellus scandens TaxID=2682957 RepID=A0ABR1JHP4_9AGAR
MPSAISIPPTSDFFIPHWAFTPLKDDTVDFSAIGVDNQPEVTISASSTIQSSSISTTSPIAQSPIASPTQSPNTSPTQTSNTSPAQLPKIQPTVISTALSTATVAAERLTSIFAAQPTAISTAESATISAAQSTGISVTQFTTFATEFTSISTTPSAGILPTQSSSINSSSRSPSLGVIVGSVSGGVLVVLLAIIFCWLRRRRLSRRLPSGSGTDSRFRTDPFIFPAPAVLLPSKRLERGRNDFAQEWQQSGHESSFTKGVLTASPNFGYSEERPMIQKHSRNLSDETRATNDSDQTWTMVTQNQENLLLREEASGIQTSEFQLREMQIKMERLAAEFGEIRRFASPPAYQVSGPGIGYAI